MTALVRKEGETPYSRLLATLPLPREAREILRRNLLRVEVCSTGKEICLYFAAHAGLQDQWLNMLTEALAQHFPCQAEFRTMVLPRVRGPWQEGLEKEWLSICQSLEDEFPFLQGCEEAISYQIEGNDCLCLILPSPFLAELLQQKQRQLENFFLRLFGKKLLVKLKALNLEWEDKGLALKERREEEARKFLAQLVRGESREEEKLPLPLVGKPVSDEPLPLEQVRGTMGDFVVAGEVLGWECRPVKADRSLFTIVISDRTDSIAVKLFCNSEKGKAIEQACQRRDVWLLVRGSLEEDRYSGEEVLWASDITLIPARRRMETEGEKRVELHLHTQMSALDATVRLEDLFATLKQWGHQAVAITDHGVLQAYPEAYALGKKYGIKVLYGVEGYMVNQGQDRGKAFHIILLAKNQRGLQDLYRLVSLSHLEHFYRVPRIPREALLAYRDNLLVGTACEAGELIQAYLQGLRGEELAEIARFYDYIEIQPWANNAFLIREGRINREGLLTMNRELYTLGKRLGLPVVATGDVHFLEPEDALLRRILLTAQGFEDAEHQPPLYLRTTEEMLAEFSYLGEEAAREVVVENPRKIAALIDEVRPIPDGLHAPQIPGAEEQIRSMAFARAKELYGEPLPPLVADRLEKELAAIIGNGFAVIYLIAHKLVSKSLSDGYLVGSRGSVGSSFVATMCGITEVNPLPPHYRCPHCRYSSFIADGSVGSGFDLPARACPRCGRELVRDGHNIPFEVFMGFEGDKVPDIDLNFSGEYQPLIHQYAEELFGSDKVFRAGTISTIADRTAYGFVKGYFTEKGQKPRSVEIDRLVKACTGIKRTTGQHPGGLMIIPSGRDIFEFTPIQYPADAKSAGVITTHFDYHAISSRLLKLDLLGHDDPTVLRMLVELTGVDVKKIPFDDPGTMAIFSGLGDLGLDPELFDIPIGTIGIPEFGTRFVRQMLAETRPSTFAELVRISGLSHGTDVWLNNAQEYVRAGTATLSEVISTRDDIMTFLLEKGVPARHAFNIMERVRKGKGLAEEDIKIMEDVGIPQWYIDSCQKIKYMFPKAHAVAYVMMAFRIAWFKVHYPEAFYASYFTVRANDFDITLTDGGLEGIRRHIAAIDKKGNEASPKEKSLLPILEVALEMYARGYKFRRIDLNKSDSRVYQITPTGLLPPFTALPGVGQGAANNIVQAREEGPFTSVEDLRIRARLSRNVIEALRRSGCLAHLPETDQLLLFAE
ncbi:MAG TPA: PolC-type DNA polymerase III [Firmicutes bacterium]|nr:PolC-type DNA polymerase III [Bacillota bacterium]